MLRILLRGFVFIFVASIANLSWGAIKCSDFDKEAERFKLAAERKQKEISQIEKQLSANQNATQDFNRNCRVVSNPRCNPMMYKMISDQSVVLLGKRQSFANEIRTLKSKKEDALEKKTSCLLAIKKKFH